MSRKEGIMVSILIDVGGFQKPSWGRASTTILSKDIKKIMQKRNIELKKSNMADEREKYQAELRKWYDGGQKGEKPEMPITPAQKKMLQQFGDMEIPTMGSTKLKMAAPITKGGVFK